jgi:hypothetical protein
MPPATRLSAEDQAIIARWRAEVGEETLCRIVAAIAAPVVGRPATIAANELLLRQMAEAARREPTSSPFALARDAASTAEGQREARRRNITTGGLAKTLQRQFAQHRVRLMRGAVNRINAPTPMHETFMGNSLSQGVFNVLFPLHPLPPQIAEQFENAKRMSELLLPSRVLPISILPLGQKPPNFVRARTNRA